MQNCEFEKIAANVKADDKAREEKAVNYFYHVKERKAFYVAEGDTYDFGDHNEAFLHYTDEEVAHIKTLIVEAVNQDEDCEPVSTVEEALDELSYHELFERSEELRKLLGERLYKANVCANTIDFDNKVYFYKFSIVGYDYHNNKVVGPITEEIILTDEQYLQLLKYQVNNRRHFNFNHLLMQDPKLANYLNRQVSYFCPYMILFDEVRADAEIIDGPIDAYDVLYDGSDETRLYRIHANAQHGEMDISEEEMIDGKFTKNHDLDNIDAIKVLKTLECTTYEEMFAKMKERFHSASCFADIKEWLDNQHIEYQFR